MAEEAMRKKRAPKKKRTPRRTADKRKRAPRLPPAERQARLVHAAIRVFAERGIGAARPVDVANAAGVAESTIFAYFASRDALVSAVLAEVDRFCSEVNDTVLRQVHRPVPDLVVELANAFAESVDSHPHHARVWLDWSTAIRDDVWPRYLEFQERIIAGVSALIRRGQKEGSVAADVNAEDEARMLYGSAQMAAQMQFSGRSAAAVRRFLESMQNSTRKRLAPRDRTPAPTLRA
jgi:TetR/AcrR family hemagglutinin/protease transcriptional regulator